MKKILLMFFTLFLSFEAQATTCTSDFDCKQGNSGYGFGCNTTTNSCYTCAVGDSSCGTCSMFASGYVPSGNGGCQKAGCNSDSDCLDGKKCNSATHQCVSCVSDFDCKQGNSGYGFGCNTTTNSCYTCAVGDSSCGTCSMFASGYVPSGNGGCQAHKTDKAKCTAPLKLSADGCCCSL